MPALTFRMSTDNGGLQETDLTLATSVSGWTVAKLASPQSSDYNVGSEKASGTFSSNATTAKPTALNVGVNALKTATPISGQFAAGNWVFTFLLRSVTAAGGTVRIRVRVYRGAASDGSGATELTAATQVGTTTAALSTSADVTSTVTWTPGAALTFNNEYLFFTVALEVVTAGASNSSDALFRVGTSANGSRLVTPVFTGIDAATVYLSLTPSAVEEAPPTLDSGTVYLSLTPSAVEGRELIDPSPAPILQPVGTTFQNFGNTTVDQVGQRFTPDVNSKVTAVDVALAKTGSPTDTLVAEIQATTAGQPNGTVLGTSDPINSSSLTTGKVLYRFYFPVEVPLTAGTGYVYVIRRTGAVDDANDFKNYYSSGNPYAGGIWYRRATSTGNWSGFSTQDGAFNVWFIANEPALLTLTPSASEVYTGSGSTDYLDSATAVVVLTPSSTELEEAVDSATALVKLTPSGTDVAGLVDTDTALVKLIPSSLEIQEAVDSGTARLTFTPSSADIADVVDAATARVSLIPSSSDIGAFVDSAIVNLLISPSTVQEGTEHTDTNTALVNFTVSAVEIGPGLEDAATVLVNLLPSSTDVAAYVDSAVSIVKITPSVAETAAYIDASTVALALTPGLAQEGVERSDSATSLVRLTPSSTDVADYSDSGNVLVKFTPSASEAREITDAGTMTINIVPSSADVGLYVDAATVALALTPSGTDLATTQYVDAATARVLFTPSGTDTLSGQSVDAGTVPLSLQPSGVELAQFVDLATVPVKLTPSGTEARTSDDANEVKINLSPSAQEFANYVDGGIARSTLTPSGSDIPEYTDSGIAIVRFSPSGVEARTSFDAGTATIVLSPSSTELAGYIDSSVVLLKLEPLGFDEIERLGVDAGTVYLQFKPMLLFVTTGVLYGRWMVRLRGVVEQASFVRDRFKARLRPRWSNSSLFRG